jgi:hypothetical protein
MSEQRKTHEIKTRDERKWFSYIKEKAITLGYGQIEMSIIIKGGKVVAIKSIREIDNFNIREE